LAASQLPARGGNLRENAGQLPANRPGAGERPFTRPEQRPNWNEWSQNRGQNWQQAVNNRQDFWNNWSGNRQQNVNNFRQNQDQRWNQLQSNQQNRQDWFSNQQNNRQNWRVDNREDWQNHRENMWDYRWDRADDVWDNVRDFHDDLFDDRWWGGVAWGAGAAVANVGSAVAQRIANPWWWWQPTSWNSVSSVVQQPAVQQPAPVYYDYGSTVIYEGGQVYQNGQRPVPAEAYNEQAIDLAATVEQPPPPEPTAGGASASPAEEWMPLGVFALAQEEKGDPIMFFQISVNKEGIISGGYQNVLTGEQKPIAGRVDKQSQRAAWRIGDNENTVLETGLFNLTKDVTPVSIHFGPEQTQTWLLVRLPAPQMPGSKTPPDTAIDRKLPPVMGKPAT
jgi:hypothetical protein